MEGDKRVHPRFLFSEPVAFSLPGVSVNGCVAGNISLGGISLKVQGFVPIGTILELQIRFGQSPQVIWVKAQVVRMREVSSEDCYEIGLKFCNDKESIKAIGKHVSVCRSESTQQKELKSYG